MPGNAPLTAVQLLWVNMIMDTLGALALATEPPNDELMKREPVGRTGKFITNVMWRNIMGQSFYQFFVMWYLQTQGKSFFGLDDDSDTDIVLNTIIFNSFVFCQVLLPLKIHSLTLVIHLLSHNEPLVSAPWFSLKVAQFFLSFSVLFNTWQQFPSNTKGISYFCPAVFSLEIIEYYRVEHIELT